MIGRAVEAAGERATAMAVLAVKPGECISYNA